MDYYVPNDFSGWRYQQLVRPEHDAIDYARVQSLLFYYNGLPGKSTVACGIDDVKALRSLDARELVDPYIEVSGQRFTWQGRLAEGQYLTFWPGEPVRRHGPPLEQPEVGPPVADGPALPAGQLHRPLRLGRRSGHAAARPRDAAASRTTPPSLTLSVRARYSSIISLCCPFWMKDRRSCPGCNASCDVGRSLFGLCYWTLDIGYSMFDRFRWPLNVRCSMFDVHFRLLEQQPDSLTPARSS